MEMVNTDTKIGNTVKNKNIFFHFTHTISFNTFRRTNHVEKLSSENREEKCAVWPEFESHDHYLLIMETWKFDLFLWTSCVCL